MSHSLIMLIINILFYILIVPLFFGILEKCVYQKEHTCLDSDDLKYSIFIILFITIITVGADSYLISKFHSDSRIIIGASIVIALLICSLCISKFVLLLYIDEYIDMYISAVKVIPLYIARLFLKLLYRSIKTINKKHYLNDLKLDFETPIKDTKIKDDKALIKLTKVNEELIPQLIELNDYKRKLKNADDKTISLIKSDIKDVKEMIMNECNEINEIEKESRIHDEKEKYLKFRKTLTKTSDTKEL